MGTQPLDAMDYAAYQPTDFAADPTFQDWVLTGDPQAATFWEPWAAAHPEKQGDLAEARALVRLLHEHANRPAYPAERTEALDRLRQTLDLAPPRRRVLRLGWGRWAAAAVLVLGLGLAVYVLNRPVPAATEVLAQGGNVRQTDFGKTDTLTLPDGSRVMLNANSKLRFSTWKPGQDRAVWLDGEAFFDVTHREPTPGQPIKFTVHTAGVRIEVLGTRFNVRHRRNRVQVVLNEGKIRLRLAGDSTRRGVVMRPGQLVEVADSQRSVLLKSVRPELFSSWKTRRFLFDHTPLSEVAEQIEDVYGWRVRFAEEALKSETLTGTIPTHDEKVLFAALSAALDLDVTRTDNQVLFQRRY